MDRGTGCDEAGLDSWIHPSRAWREYRSLTWVWNPIEKTCAYVGYTVHADVVKAIATPETCVHPRVTFPVTALSSAMETQVQVTLTAVQVNVIATGWAWGWRFTSDIVTTAQPVVVTFLGMFDVTLHAGPEELRDHCASSDAATAAPATHTTTRITATLHVGRVFRSMLFRNRRQSRSRRLPGGFRGCDGCGAGDPPHRGRSRRPMLPGRAGPDRPRADGQGEEDPR